eukprot:gene9782-10781_t
MPTVILLDVSLSMSRRVAGTDGRKTDLQLRHLAVQGIHHFLDEMKERCRLEFTALIAFSSLWEIVVPFTRDIAALKSGCLTVDVYDKTCIENALHGVENLVMDEWGSVVPVNVILVTDGRLGTGKGTLKESISKAPSEEANFPLPFSFPSNLSIVCIADQNVEHNFSDSMSSYRKLIDINRKNGEIYLPESPLNVNNIEQCFHKIILNHYESFEGTLLCGNLKSEITLSPAPNFKNSWMMILESYRQEHCDLNALKMPNELKIIGFLDIADISNPPYISRHIVIPIRQKSETNEEQVHSPLCSEEDGKNPCFCVLLHGSLKIEKMVAAIQLGSDWHGMLYSWSDNRKKSALMLSVFEPGLNISWLGKLSNLGPSAELPINPYQYDPKEDAEETPYPVAPNKRRSYHLQPNVVWVRNAGLQSDIQKVMRYAKKLPEKHSAFFKELNRLRRAGLCYSFHQLLFHVADLLEKEARGASNEVARQLMNAASELRLAPKRGLARNIGPMPETV